MLQTPGCQRGLTEPFGEADCWLCGSSVVNISCQRLHRLHEGGLDKRTVTTF
jgi:hypothetical protein